MDQIKQLAHEYGAVIVFALTLLLSAIKYIFGARPKLFWRSDFHYFHFFDDRSNQKFGTCFQSIIVENVGRGIAKNIEIIVPAKNLYIKMERERAGWNLFNHTVLTSDRNFEANESGNLTKILIPSLEGKQILKIAYGTDGTGSSQPASITVDGKIAEKRALAFNYITSNEVLFRSIKSMWPVWLAVALFLLLSIIPDFKK
jgi:hypothetical protein